MRDRTQRYQSVRKVRQAGVQPFSEGTMPKEIRMRLLTPTRMLTPQIQKWRQLRVYSITQTKLVKTAIQGYTFAERDADRQATLSPSAPANALRSQRWDCICARTDSRVHCGPAFVPCVALGEVEFPQRPLATRDVRVPASSRDTARTEWPEFWLAAPAPTCRWKSSVSHHTGPSCRNLSKRYGGRKGVRCRRRLSLHCPRAEQPGSKLNHSASGCVGAFASPLPLPLRNCRCGHRLGKSGVLGKRGFPLECAAAQVCREAGGRVSTNVFIRDLDLAEFNALDNRLVEVIADGLPLWQRAHMAIDTTLVSLLCGDGAARGRAADHSGSALKEARRRKESELVGEEGRARLVVLAAEGGVGGQMRQPSFFKGWPKRVPILCHLSSKAE